MFTGINIFIYIQSLLLQIMSKYDCYKFGERIGSSLIRQISFAITWNEDHIIPLILNLSPLWIYTTIIFFIFTGKTYQVEIFISPTSCNSWIMCQVSMFYHKSKINGTWHCHSVIKYLHWQAFYLHRACTALSTKAYHFFYIKNQ